MKQTKQFLRPLLMAIVMLVGMLVPQGAWAEDLWVDYGETITISSDASYDVIGVYPGGELIINEGVTLTVTESLNIHGDIDNLYGIVINYGTIIGDGYLQMYGGVLANHGHFDLVEAYADGTFYNTGTFGVGFLNLTPTECNHDYYRNLGPVEATCTHGAGTQFKCSMCHYIWINDETSERSPHTFDNETDPHHTHCTECKHSWIYYTTMDGEDFEDFEDFFPNAFNHGFDSENNYHYIEFAYAMTEITEFGYCEKLATVILPSSVTSIGNLAFVTCSSLNSIILPSSLESIGWSAFDGCTSLESITLPNSLESIGNLAFYQSGLTCITIPESVTSIGPGAFAYCESLTSFTTPCTLDLSNAGVPGNAINRLHDEESKRLTAEPVADGLYTYTCDKGCGHYDEHRFIKDFNGAGNHLALTTDGEGNYSTSEDITLADANGFVSPVDFTAASVTYTRTGIKNQWGTIVVPFDVTGSDEYDFYTLTSATNEELTLTKVNGTLNAGTPALIRINTELVTDQTYNLELNSAEGTVTVNADVENGSSADGLTLTGSYSVKDITAENGYIISNNKFWSIQEVKGDNNVYCAPFRAYIASSAPASAKALNISISEEADAIEAITAITEGDAEYYDLNGRKLTSLQTGVNIVKYSNGKTKKVIVK